MNPRSIQAPSEDGALLFGMALDSGGRGSGREDGFLTGMKYCFLVIYFSVLVTIILCILHVLPLNGLSVIIKKKM